MFQKNEYLDETVRRVSHADLLLREQVKWFAPRSKSR